MSTVPRKDHAVNPIHPSLYISPVPNYSLGMNFAEIESGVRRASDATEHIYVELGQLFPALLSFERDVGGNPVDTLTALIADLREGFASADADEAGSFASFQRRNEGLFRSLSERMAGLSGVNERVVQIRTDSEELEVISLNAMVISIKSGERGRAFSCITEHLKALSARLIRLTDDLKAGESRIVERNEGLRGSFGALTETQRGIEALGRDDETMRVRGVVEEAGSALLELAREAERVRDPIRSAMGSLQIQDIVRQSIDQVVLALDGLDESATGEESHARLDRLSFNVEILALVEKILSDVDAHLADSVRGFARDWAEVRDRLAAVEALRSRFVSRFLDPRSKSPDSLADILERMVSRFRDYVDRIASFQRGQRGLVRDSSVIVSEVKRLRDLFDTIKPVISRLQHVRITQQIEVAKNDAIAAVRGTVDHMSELILRADERVQSTRKELDAFISGIEELIADFASGSERDHADLERVRDGKLSFFNRMRECQEELSGAVLRLQVYPDSFQAMCRRVDALASELSGVEAAVASFRDEASRKRVVEEQERDRALADLGIESWAIHDERFRSMVEKFTITAHKEEAGRIAGFDVEGAAAAGEVTLFV